MTTRPDARGPGFERGGFRWLADASAGAWLAGRLDADWEAPGGHHIVPRGFPAALRLFHRLTADRPVGMSWAAWHAADQRARQTGSWAEAPVDIEERRATWRELADAFGVPWRPEITWTEIVLARSEGSARASAEQAALAGEAHAAGRPWLPQGSWQWLSRSAQAELPLLPDGWRPWDVPEGDLGAAESRALAAALTRATDPDTRVIAAVWSGWGSLFSSARSQSSIFGRREDGSPLTRGDIRCANRAVRDEATRSTLPRVVERGPRLLLPNREYLLFSGPLGRLALPEPRGPDAVAGRLPWFTGSDRDDPEPVALLWPEDRSWLLVTEIDANNSVLLGDPALLARVHETPELESELLPEGSLERWSPAS